jgi:hypothetical protein
MRKQAVHLPWVLCILMLCASAPSQAGDVKLVSDTWDNICSVEVTWGPEAPNDTPVEYHSDVSRGWSITKPGPLCYRRPSTPDNCESGMTQWKTQWRCSKGTAAGVEELSLK